MHQMKAAAREAEKEAIEDEEKRALERELKEEIALDAARQSLGMHQMKAAAR